MLKIGIMKSTEAADDGCKPKVRMVDEIIRWSEIIGSVPVTSERSFP
jgi:hypothetical protein